MNHILTPDGLDWRIPPEAQPEKLAAVRPRRRRVLLVATELMTALLHGELGALAISDAPADLRVVGALHHDWNNIALCVESDTFDDVPPYEELPYVTFTFRNAGSTDERA
jgi:hypothetical protein